MRRTRRTLAGLIGIAATVLLHSLLLAMAVWGGDRFRIHLKQPDAIGAGANSGKPEGEPGERRILVMLTPEFAESTPSFEPPSQLSEPVIEPPSVVEITGLDTKPLPPMQVDIPSENAEEQDAQLMARARFAGIYESQVRARIERAWSLPQDPAPDPGFSCLAQIHQQKDGRVLEVDLVLSKCNGSPAWQQSLVTAIFRASPLPAPPHPSVFVDRFSLVLSSSPVKIQSRTVKR